VGSECFATVTLATSTVARPVQTVFHHALRLTQSSTGRVQRIWRTWLSRPVSAGHVPGFDQRRRRTSHCHVAVHGLRWTPHGTHWLMICASSENSRRRRTILL